MFDAVIVVPTLNPGDDWGRWIDAYNMQTLRLPCCVIDSASDDDVVERSIENGFKVKVIERSGYDHGGTRNMAMASVDSEFVIFMTQDAILKDENSIELLLSVLKENAEIAAVYGRQLPRPQADVFESFIRHYNYPQESYIRSYEDRANFGIKAAFMSNSFAAYRRSALESIGGFPDGLIFGEDMLAAAMMLKQGWLIAYAADACVIHSHGYTPVQEFRRYFDMGVLHAENPWLSRDFGAAESAGRKFVSAELRYTYKHSARALPEGFLRTFMRYFGFKLGLKKRYLPLPIKRKFSMNKGYFS